MFRLSIFQKWRIFVIGLSILLIWVLECTEHFLLKPTSDLYFFLELVVFTLFFGIVLNELFRYLFRMDRQLSNSQLQLHSLQQFQAKILESSPCAIISLSPSGIIRSFNREAERITGYTAREVHIWN